MLKFEFFSKCFKFLLNYDFQNLFVCHLKNVMGKTVTGESVWGPHPNVFLNVQQMLNYKHGSSRYPKLENSDATKIFFQLRLCFYG